MTRAPIPVVLCPVTDYRRLLVPSPAALAVPQLILASFDYPAATGEGQR